MVTKLEEYLIFGKPAIGKKEIDAVVEVMKSGWLGTGPKVKVFEENMSNFLCCKQFVATNSCTSALHLSLIINNIGRGDKVIVPSLTFCATANVVEHVGATPVFADIEKDTFNIDPKSVENSIDRDTKAIIPVHFGGLPCDMDEINNIAEENKMVVIEDCAHAIGAEYKGKKIGHSKNNCCFSFYTTKNLTTVDGGGITARSDKEAELLRKLILHGIDKDAWKRYSNDENKTYDVVEAGYKYNLTDILATIGIEQLKEIEKFNLYRKAYAETYINELKNHDLIKLPRIKFLYKKSSWHLFPIVIKTEELKIDRDQFIQEMHKRNVGVGVHYNPLHLSEYYRPKQPASLVLPQTEYVGERILSLPLQYTMSLDQVKKVSKIVIEILEKYRK